MPVAVMALVLVLAVVALAEALYLPLAHTRLQMQLRLAEPLPQTSILSFYRAFFQLPAICGASAALAPEG